MESIFKDFIVGNHLQLNEVVFVNINTFSSIFKGAKTYEEFIEIDNGKKGYKEFFDKCKDEGILN